ncbi:5-hydroxytryptamine receptor 1A [Diorhabda carinulata]|uniref:5-hydroxytryptamine receptor 1A-like n=1 Tax=Diorhabda sublineata TaxID=1163346 RepID=UPI0024E0AA8A|nr:5-hydroxytryptamine receptor 1A-like [Diorhabda sublineata]XP_057672473.1 5-hydroxytryptamine receptor 1A [Diorhabda carinulata]
MVACEFCGTTLWMVTSIGTTFLTILGNTLTLCTILMSKKLSSLTANYFIFSLAVSDLMVGVSIPYHMLFYTKSDFGAVKIRCLLRFVLTSFACSSSICNLLFIAMDRYLAIVYPLHYARFMVKKTAYALIAVGWVGAFSAAFVPLIWNEWTEGVTCEVVNVFPHNYMQFILLPMFSLIWTTMFLLYTRICQEASGQQKKIRVNGLKHHSKSFQVTLIILGCFTICWLPYFVIVVYIRSTKSSESATLYEVFFNLAMANSCMNPLIYAWKNKNFRKGFFSLLKCRHPDKTTDFVTNHVPSKRNSANAVWNIQCHREELTTGTEMSNYDEKGDNVVVQGSEENELRRETI